jgi:microcystin-dependent protein
VAEPFLGEIRAFGFNFAPRGWAMCNGQILSIAQNTALFSLLGTMYGGNGQTTFALPDLRTRAPMHLGQGPGLSSRTQGEQAGQEVHTLIATEMPAHAHAQPASSGEQDTNRPANAVPARGGVYAASGDGTVLDATTASGGSQPHNNMPPYLVLNFCIALEGIFPSRN